MRTFVAVEIRDNTVLDAIAKLQSDLQIKATHVSRQNMHFTLLFLGEISEESANSVKNALSEISFKPINVRFTHVGVFPNSKFPRVIWVGVDNKAAERLVELALQVEEKLAPLGFRSDKPFKPHLTIFRIKSRTEDIANKIERFKSVNLGKDITITELKFKKSILTPNGPVYSDLEVISAHE